MKVFASYNIKGGVGKTTTAVNLAYLSSKEGGRTLVWDLDPQGAASFCFRIRPREERAGWRLVRGKLDAASQVRGTDFEGLDLLPADFSNRELDLALDRTRDPAGRIAAILADLEADYDCVFLDCPPSISLLSESVFEAADALLVPTIPTTLSLRTLDQLERHLAQRRSAHAPLLLPFFCLVDARKALHREIVERAAGGGGPAFLAASIPYASAVERMAAQRTPLFVYAFGSPAARAYEALWREVRRRVFEVGP